MNLLFFLICTRLIGETPVKEKKKKERTCRGSREIKLPLLWKRENKVVTCFKYVRPQFNSREVCPNRWELEPKYFTLKSSVSQPRWDRGMAKEFVVVAQLLSHAQLFVIPGTAAHQPPLSYTVSWGLLKFMSVESVKLSNHLILCCLLLLFLQSFPASGSFQWVSSLHQVAKYWSFSISPSSSGLISFRIDWFDLLAVQGALKNLLQHHNSRATILWCSVFFMVQLSHPYMTTGKTIALTRRTFVGKVMSLLFNMLSRFVIVFLPKSKHLLISWLQSLSTVILEPKKIKSVTVSTFPPSICHEVMGPDAMILVFWVLSFKPAFFTRLLHPH